MDKVIIRRCSDFKIFKNLYNELGWEIENAIKRDDWKDTKNLISKGRNWIIDDNMKHIYRLHKNQKVRMNTGSGIRIFEDFKDLINSVVSPSSVRSK